ncbi:MAG: hypothetical protein D6806_17085, partial [Deltaproteobacteria bacterium]
MSAIRNDDNYAGAAKKHCAVLLAICAICLSGCRDEKPHSQPASGPAKASNTSQVAGNDAGAAEEPKPPTVQAAAPNFDEPVDPSKAPEEVKQMVKYLDEITSIIHQGMPECEKVAKRLVEYTDKNRKRMIEVQNNLEKLASGQTK